MQFKMPDSKEETAAIKTSATSDKMEEHTKNPINKTTTGPQMMALNTHKAGMEGLDAEKINEIIKKASEGSRFYQHKQKSQQRLDTKISEMLKAKDSFSEQMINKAIIQMDKLLNELEVERDLTQTIVHVDMDMFYAAVEMRDNPSLRDKPMAVGGTGMLSTSNYAARKFGVRAAMPGFIGKKLCPDLIIVPPNFTKYKKSSKEIQEIFAEYDPNFSPMSLDEAYLNITDYMKKNAHLYDTDGEDDEDGRHLAESIVKELRKKVFMKTSLTASAGIAPNTRLAKVCSDMNKPNGQFYLPPVKQDILDFVSSLPVRKVSGIGNVTEQQLRSLGVIVCSDLIENRGLLRLLFTDLNYNYFMRIALGLGSTSLEAWTERDRKSISTETTFQGSADRDFLFQQIEDLCQELADELSEKDILGKVFTLKIKTIDFKVKTKAHSFFEATRSCDVMLTTARKLLQQEMDISHQPLSLRLIGVRMSSLLTSSEVGSARQATITDLFSRAGHSKTSDSVNSSKIDIVRDSESFKSAGDNDVTIEDLKGECIVMDRGEGCHTLLKSQSTNTNLITKNKSESFFNKYLNIGKTPDPTYSSFECPVCYKEIEISSIAKFNVHVDECLQSLEKVSKDFDAKEAEKISNTRIDKKEDNCANSLADKFKAESKRVQNSEMFTCPVCNQCEFYDVILLNEHLDECLNKRAIDDIMKEKGISSTSTSHNPHINSNHSFFGGIMSTNGKKRTKQDNPHPSKKMKLKNNTLENYFS